MRGTGDSQTAGRQFGVFHIGLAPRQVATQELPKEIKAKQMRLEQVQKSLGGQAYTQFAIDELTKTVDRMKREAGRLLTPTRILDLP